MRCRRSQPQGQAVIDTSWQDKAACRGTNAEFVTEANRGTADAEALAWRYCSRCPAVIVAACSAYADGLTPKAVGVWAGQMRSKRGVVDLLPVGRAS